MPSYGKNEIHPTAVVPDSVVMGEGNYIGPYCVFGPNVTMGDGNHFEAHTCVGLPGEKHGFFDFDGPVFIGNDNIVREFCTIQGGTDQETIMGNKCLMLRGSHLSHDSVLQNNVNISCNVLIGGESFIMEGANLGLGAIIHQRQKIGAYAMLGMGCVVPKKAVIHCGQIYVGNPAKVLRENAIGLIRAGVTDERLAELEEQFHILRFGNYDPGR